ncbi:MAG: Dna2/Cas4 domain-containing protein [DPANN group archaeon]|nr:Dna2/Cas4 domain-containing protein [DPANN group archaeon]
MVQQPLKIKCPTGKHHTVEEARLCPNCAELFPGPILQALLADRTRVSKPKEKPAFGIGNLVSNCLRQSFYKLTEEQILDLDKLWIFSRGHAIHQFITHTLTNEEKEIFVKKEFPQFDIIGFVDAIHNNVIYEFKTTANIPDEPQTSHLLQAQAYFSMLPKEKQNLITSIKVIYLSLQKVKPYEIPKRDITAYLESRAMQLFLGLKKKLPPEKEVSWLCKYCDFYEKCFDKKVDFID